MMITDLKTALQSMKAVAAVTYKEWAAFRSHAMISIFVGPVFYLVQMYIWTAVYAGSDSENINGMSLRDMLTYYAVTALIYYLTMDFADWNLQMLVRTGKYTAYALRPMNHMYFAFCQKLGHRLLGIIFEFTPVLVIFIFVFRIHLLPHNALYAAASLILCFFMNFAINYAIGTAAFWLTKTDGMRNMYHLFRSVFSGSLIPLAFFPAFTHRIMLYLPFPYTAYVPAMIYTGNTGFGAVSAEPAVMLAVQAAYTIIALLAAYGLYRLGMRRYTGVGA